MDRALKLYLLSLEIIPLLDDVEIEGIKMQRTAKRFCKGLETFANDAANEFYKHEETRNKIEKLRNDFSEYIDIL
mgnify:CR=1 FL=1